MDSDVPDKTGRRSWWPTHCDVQIAQLAKEFNLSFAVWPLIHASIQQGLNTWKCSEMKRQETQMGEKRMNE